jgi:hypothetical protein
VSDAFSDSVLGPDPLPLRQNQRLIAQAIISMADAIGHFARLFAELDPLDLSDNERERLEHVRQSLDDVLDQFHRDSP